MNAVIPTTLLAETWPDGFLKDDMTAVLLIGLVCVVAFAGLVMICFVVRHLLHRRLGATPATSPAGYEPENRFLPTIFDAPVRWLAIKSVNPQAVQAALGLQHARRCSWNEAVTAPFEPRLFIAPPIDGWVLVLGCDLPDPAEDVDACFVFLTHLSRELGHVQFFSANRVINQHAWARLEAGTVLRAYAWAGETLWNQGPLTSAEMTLKLRCLDYTEAVGELNLTQRELLATNTEKVLRLAGCWSLDPTDLEKSRLQDCAGIAGALLHSKPH